MPIKEPHFGFFGSFQCRLATDSDPPDVSPNVPAGAPDVAGRVNRPGKGWTFDFDEEAFDRVIRLSNPVNLRNGLVDPRRDTLSHGVRVDRGAGLVDVPGDPLTGLSVSLGQQVKFDASAGGGPGTEALVGFELGVGSLLKVTAPSPPRIRTTRGIPQSGVWWNEYKTVKKQRAEVIMHGMRRTVLLRLLTQYATVFGTYMGTVDGFVLSPAPAHRQQWHSQGTRRPDRGRPRRAPAGETAGSCTSTSIGSTPILWSAPSMAGSGRSSELGRVPPRSREPDAQPLEDNVLSSARPGARHLQRGKLARKGERDRSRFLRK